MKFFDRQSKGISYFAFAIPTHLRNQNLVTRLHAHGHAVSLLIKETRADSKDLGCILVLDGALGEEDAGGGLGLGLDSLDQDTVQERHEALDVTEGLNSQ